MPNPKRPSRLVLHLAAGLSAVVALAVCAVWGLRLCGVYSLHWNISYEIESEPTHHYYLYAASYSGVFVVGREIMIVSDVELQKRLAERMGQQIHYVSTIPTLPAERQFGYQRTEEDAGAIRFQDHRFFTPQWLVFLTAMVLPTCSVVQRRPQRIGPGCCAVCGYDLRASPERCPECGTEPPSTVAPTL